MVELPNGLRRQTFELLSLGLLFFTTPVALAVGGDSDTLVLLSRDRGSRTIEVALGEDIHFELAVDDGVRLVVRENRYGIHEVFVFIDRDGGIWVAGYDKYDTLLVRGQKF